MSVKRIVAGCTLVVVVIVAAVYWSDAERKAQSKAAVPDASAASILSAYNDVPIRFYGRVVDQFTNPLANSTVNFTVRMNSGAGTSAKHASATTDTNGYFEISGYSGESLSVAPSEPGYALATTETLFRYSQLDDNHFVPDAHHPALIRMWKLQGAEPLAAINQRFKMRYTNAPMAIDLPAGQIVPSGGDIKITIERPGGEISAAHPQDWSVRVDANGGGVVDCGDHGSIIYWAPESGYQPGMVLQASTNGHGVELIQEDLIAKSREGRVFSKFTITVRINRDPDGEMTVALRGAANTNASRNFEGAIDTAASAAR